MNIFRSRPGSWALAMTMTLVVPAAEAAAPARAAKSALPVPADFDAYVARAMREFQVPGLAVAVVKDGRPAFAKGYGLRRLGGSDPVTPNTLFGIASNTKAFTAAALAMLVDEGKIAWDDPVTRHLPSFQLYDPYVTREITVRDLLTHRSGLGLGAGDLMFFPPTTFTRDEIVERLRYIKPATSFRSRYAYDNSLYLVAGQLVSRVSGKSWDEFVKERIFTPLGMTTSKTSIHAFRPADEVASPHSEVEGVVKPVEPHGLDNNAPAGAINSSVAEMSRWIAAQLDGGRYQDPAGKDQRLFSETQAKEMWAAQTILPIGDGPGPRPRFAAYGLGWGLRDYQGRKVVSHTGGLLGMVSQVLLVPEEKLGLVVLTNQEAGGAFRAIAWRIVDHALAVPATDWVKTFKDAADAEGARASQTLQEQAGKRAVDSKPALALEAYCGTYRDPWYGDVTIALEGGLPVMRFSRTPSFVGDVQHWQYDTFVVRWRDRSLNADAFLTFALKADGSIEQVKMAPVSPLTDFSFDFQDLLFTPMPAAAPASAH